MAKKSYSYVRACRRRWGLTQRELALLIGLSSSTTVSRIERSQRGTTTATLTACSVVFGLTTPELFPPFYENIEEAVVTAAKLLHEELGGHTDKRSKLKRALLEDILARVIKRNESPKV
jgi:transcriptional regulator with XRE-family HTH domain